VWLNGMEVTQFTYFQQAGGIECFPVTGEITYGLERIAMYLQGVDSVYDLVWADGPGGPVSYGDVFHQNEVEMSRYNFEEADVAACSPSSTTARARPAADRSGLPLPAYEMVMKASHTFNLLDARHADLRDRAAALHPARAHASPAAAPRPTSMRVRIWAFPWPRRHCATPRWPGNAEDGRMSAALAETVRTGLRGAALQQPEAALGRGLGDRAAGEQLEQRDLSHGDSRWFATPRRLAVLVDALASRRRTASGRPWARRWHRPGTTRATGPGPRRALRPQGHPDALQRIDTPKGQRLGLRETERGADTRRLPRGLVNDAVAALPIAKRMRWGAGRSGVRAAGALGGADVRGGGPDSGRSSASTAVATARASLPRAA
jgi:hypothetical protein